MGMVLCLNCSFHYLDLLTERIQSVQHITKNYAEDSTNEEEEKLEDVESWITSFTMVSDFIIL